MGITGPERREHAALHKVTVSVETTQWQSALYYTNNGEQCTYCI